MKQLDVEETKRYRYYNRGTKSKASDEQGWAFPTTPTTSPHLRRLGSKVTRSPQTTPWADTSKEVPAMRPSVCSCCCARDGKTNLGQQRRLPIVRQHSNFEVMVGQNDEKILSRHIDLYNLGSDPERTAEELPLLYAPRTAVLFPDMLLLRWSCCSRTTISILVPLFFLVSRAAAAAAAVLSSLKPSPPQPPTGL